MTVSSPITPAVEQRLHSELIPTEQLIWSGKPLANRALMGGLAFVPGGVLIAAFCVFMANIAIGTNQDGNPMTVLFLLFGTPFVLSALWLLTFPYWMWRKARKTVYAITDMRALILSPAWHGKISARSIPPEDFSPRTLKQNRDGSGTLFFTNLTTSRRSGGGGTYAVYVGFENITNVRDVNALLDRTFSSL